MDTATHFGIDELIGSRRSMREFSLESVSLNVISEVFEVAGYAPSNCNTQPWEVHVVQGRSTESMSNALLETIGNGDFQLDFPFDDANYTGVFKERQREAGRLCYETAGIGREDNEGRHEFFHRNLRFYGAPQAAFFSCRSGVGYERPLT